MSDLERYLIPNTDSVYYIPDFISVDEEAFLFRKIDESPLPRWKGLANRRLQIWGGSITAKGVLVPEGLPPFVTQFPDLTTRIKNTGVFASAPHGRPNHIIMNEVSTNYRALAAQAHLRVLHHGQYLPGQGIMPHEDGPAYHPVVATISLGSHTVFHYYRYRPRGHEGDSEAVHLEYENEHERGRSIDPTPVLSLLLEPRSLVITTGAMYSTHLHGIEGLGEDVFVPGAVDIDPSQDAQPSIIANIHLLKDAAARDAVTHGGVLQRGTRHSLTCRDVGKVAGGLLTLAKR